MKISNERKFIERVESLIDPMAVSNLLVFQKLKIVLPPFVMKGLLHRAAKKTPNIGFVIEPYSLFLFFKLTDIEKAKAMLPERYELAKTRIFADEEPDHYLGIGNLRTRASTFWGTRQESYLIARDKQTGLLSWIFIDILSDTVIAQPAKGIVNPNCKRALFTTTSKGEIILDIEEKKTERRLSLRGSIDNGKSRSLDQTIWLMGNTSIGHSRKFVKGEDKPFAVIFDPAEVEKAMDIPTEDIRITENNLFPGLAEPSLSKVLCFPFAQHYIADSPGCRTSVKDHDDMVNKYEYITESEQMKTFSAKTIVRQISFSFIVSTIIIVSLLFIF